ncbi:type II secretion system protein GspM [Lacimicrobium sp. SS2-24]|uniref:type II secretion system protein GspM n=1 Tax=Lacimicrobium sp. SS2-24 TaxID=2005569 RepID=UPI000B4AEC09|nr:type II secretion system protein GspM [Lacimicrobium sp. SS2-24]
MNYQQLKKWFSERQPRERQLVLLAGLFLILYGGYLLFIEPVQLQTATLERQTQQQQTQYQAITSETEALLSGSQDPDAAVKRRITQLQNLQQQQQQQIQSQTRDLVPPYRMREMLQALLADKDTLQLLEMRSLPAVNLTEEDKTDSAEAEPLPGLYQHGIVLIVEGRYFDLHRYLVELEQLPWRFQWKRLDYSVQEHPVGRMQLELYTLSTDKAFVGV